MPNSCPRFLRNALVSILLLLVTMLAGCVSAPVQEMSDARQAIAAAETAGADSLSPRALEQAKKLLRQAETGLESGAYKDAQRDAELAKQAAIEARERALELKQSVEPAPVE